ncbi:hypothetical protein LguiA_007195 [Lonicera macranthoides]
MAIYDKNLVRAIEQHEGRREEKRENEMHESKFIDRIVQEIWSKLPSKIEGTESIEGILLDPQHIQLRLQYKLKMGAEVFRKMAKLRLLKIHNTCILKGSDYLPGELRWIDWDKYPSNSLPTMFEAYVLVGLRLRHSRLKQLWDERTLSSSSDGGMQVENMMNNDNLCINLNTIARSEASNRPNHKTRPMMTSTIKVGQEVLSTPCGLAANKL